MQGLPDRRVVFPRGKPTTKHDIHENSYVRQLPKPAIINHVIMIDMEVYVNMNETVIKLLLIILLFLTSSDAMRQEVVAEVLTTISPLYHRRRYIRHFNNI